MPEFHPRSGSLRMPLFAALPQILLSVFSDYLGKKERFLQRNPAANLKESIKVAAKLAGF